MSTAKTARTQTTWRKRWLKWSLYVLAALVLGIGGLFGVLYFELHRSNGEVLTGGQKRAYYYCVRSLEIREIPRCFPSRELFREIAGFINDSKLASGFLRFVT